MSVLDYLLPKSFMSDVQTTFRPKMYDTITAPEFTSGISDGAAYQRYLNQMDAGMTVNPTAYDFLTSDLTTMKETARARGFDDVTAYMSAMEDPESEHYMYVDPSKAGEVNIFGGQSMAEGFERAGVSGFDPSMASPMKLSSLRNIDPGSYAKETSMKRGTLADKLASRRATASQVGGGFAGYGRRNLAEDLAEQQFVEGSRGVIEDVNKQRADALSELYAGLEDYQGLISSMEG
mgnify:FL=1